MTNGEAINWIINISADVGKAEHRDLWHYEQALSEIREMLESAQPDSCEFYDTESHFCALHRPSAQPTLHGYNIEHLELIAIVLQKEDLPPERVVEAITDIGRIVAIVRDEFEESLRRALQNMERETDDLQ